ncbi:PREDICTED: uncharacterized protein LOC108364008 [Rhagoletis zephyria]|uniref:uncharacterized protein LOC108364008 n=1 Tax=Rhagoletis zephyria TaxID=28612 RepID=UPI0008117EDD|nr:PREDICTED: uncharacterized protein LOC108364008 [Rhagoletis zephyria]
MARRRTVLPTASGKGKPLSLELFIRPFVDEAKEVLTNGVTINGQHKVAVKIHSFIGDSPARAFIKGFKMFICLNTFNITINIITCGCNATNTRSSDLISSRNTVDIIFSPFLGILKDCCEKLLAFIFIEIRRSQSYYRIENTKNVAIIFKSNSSNSSISS